MENLSSSPIRPTDQISKEYLSSGIIHHTKETSKEIISSSEIQTTDQTSTEYLSLSHIEPINQPKKELFSSLIEATEKTSTEHLSSNSIVPNIASDIKPSNETGSQSSIQRWISDQIKETSKLPQEVQQLTKLVPSLECSNATLITDATESNEMKPSNSKQSINIIKSEIPSLKSKIGNVRKIIPGNIDKDKVVGITGLQEQLFILTEGKHVHIRIYNLVTMEKVTNERLKFVQGPGNRFNLTDIVTNFRDGAIYILSKKGFIFCLASESLPLLLDTWKIHSGGSSLFISAAESILVTYNSLRVVHEYSIIDGRYIREIILKPSLGSRAFSPQHVISLNSNKFVICHGREDDTLNGLFSMDSIGRQINANHRNSGCDLHLPIRIIVDGRDRILILDKMNLTVRLFNEKLRQINDVIVFDEEFYEKDGKSELDYPHRFWKDIKRGNLFVAFESGKIVIC